MHHRTADKGPVVSLRASLALGITHDVYIKSSKLLLCCKVKASRPQSFEALPMCVRNDGGPEKGETTIAMSNTEGSVQDLLLIFERAWKYI